MNDEAQTGDLGTDLIIFEKRLSPAALFAPGAFDPLLAHIKSVVGAEITDATTKEGRARIKSLAMRVTRTKTAIDQARLTLVADEKRRLKKIDEEGKRMWVALEAYADEVRKPADDFDALDKARIEGHETNIARIKALITFFGEAKTDDIAGRLKIATDTDPASFEEFEADAAGAKALAISQLTPMLVSAKQVDADRAELARLKDIETQRQQRERDEQIAADATRKATEAAQAEIDKANRERLEADERTARAERDRLAEIARADQQRIDDAAIAQQRIEEAAQRERQKIADEEATAKAEAALREADKTHKAAVNNAAMQGLFSAGVPLEAAKVAVIAIALGKVPGVSIHY